MSRIQPSVPLPENGITVRRSGKYLYVYKVTSVYRTEKGNPTNTRVSIGKLDNTGTRLIPNKSYWQFYGSASEAVKVEIQKTDAQYESVKSIGATFLFRKILGDLGIVEILGKTFGAGRGEQILTAVLYMISQGNVFELVKDWCEYFTLGTPLLTSGSASGLFASITHGERMSFFAEWVKKQSLQGYLAYDVTSYSTYSVGIDDAEFGYNRDRESLAQINMGCYMGHDSGLPVFYTTYPGSIVDKSHLPFMMAYNKELGIADVSFVLDRGFCTTANVKFMHSSKLLYVCGAPTGNKATVAAIKSVRDNIVSMENVLHEGVYACSVKDWFFGAVTNMHIYYDPAIAEAKRQDIYKAVRNEEKILSSLDCLTEKEAKKFRHHFDVTVNKDKSFTYAKNMEKIDELAKNCGFFCIITNIEMDSASALQIYRRKDVIEKGFDEIKNYIEMKRLRTHNTKTTDGKMFCAFIALIAVLKLTRMLGDYMKAKSVSKGGIVSELNKIRIITLPDGMRLMNPITKTQRTIFEKCSASEDDLHRYINSA